LLVPSSAFAASYPADSVGRLLEGYGDAFRDGWISGYTEAFFMTGGECPIRVSPRMLLSALQMHVAAGRIAMTDPDQVGITQTLGEIGCTHPIGTKNKVAR